MYSTNQQQSSSTNWKYLEMASEARLRLYNSFTKKKYSARKIRLLFLLNSWSSTPDYDDRGIE